MTGENRDAAAAAWAVARDGIAARPPVYGARFMAVTGHSLASLAAVRTFQRGGNLADAAISASAVTASVLHHAAGIGGDAFLLYRDGKSDRVYGLNASGCAPALATAGEFASGMNTHGPRAPVVPGLVAAWDALHRKFGRLPWQRLFDDAIDAAAGHVVSRVAAERAGAEANELRTDAGCASLYLPDGNPVSAGAVLHQPALAQSLSRIARLGAEDFYRGRIAGQIDAFFTTHDGLIRAHDLAEFRPLWVEPLTGEYRRHQVHVMPPNSTGALLLLQLETLSSAGSAPLRDDAVFRIGTQMIAMQRTFSEAVPMIADPAAVPDAVAKLLSPEVKVRMRAPVSRQAAGAAIRDSGSTSCLVFADADGNALSLVQSIFNVFGAMLLDPATGILFNNRMHGFSHDPASANVVAPGKRPAHTLCPVLVERDGALCYAMATPGGLSQTLTNAQVLSHLVDCGFDVQQAVEFPRWCNSKSGQFLIERGFPTGFTESLLRDMGQRALVRDDGYSYGSAKVVEFSTHGTLAGGADFRREAFALGI
ncbi:MAG TPA: gamma-glutamyltransferase family protein [Micropepsaceae bacterium]|nr:gamma-glutamyltransferase family protein [Micropepsaceae bacterium]